jgi:[protein-PII] uridylyltransferase
MGTRERRLRSNECDLLISELFLARGANSRDLAIAAVGSFGRGELAPGSDLDIVIIHKGTQSEDELSATVNAILYPLWDKKMKIDHSVRTVSQARDALEEDLKVAMGLLDIRYICGDAELVEEVQLLALNTWRNRSGFYLSELRTSLDERHLRTGELAYLLEPDLKEARGGLRDITALRAMNTSGAVDLPMERVGRAESLLSTVREALHIVSNRDKDRLLFTEQDKVAAHLNYNDADALMSDVAQAARAVDYLMQLAWHRYQQSERAGFTRFLRKERRTSVGQGISVAHKEVVIDPSYDFDSDPVIGLRAAATAAQLGIRISFDSLEQYAAALREGKGVLTNPWPRQAREYLITLIGAGPSMIEIFEALDQEEILFYWLPEWSAVRSLPQRNALHRHTVDRHMVETAVAAAAHTREVYRPDLLLFTALFHDIGKGSEEDHSLRGAKLIEPIAERIGFNESDIAVIQILIEHHLLLSSTATRRDLDDPATVSSITQVIPELRTLELLHALSVADGEATGRAAWSDWKASLVADLVRRTELALTDNSLVGQPELTDAQVEKARLGELSVTLDVRGDIYALEIIAPDKTGLLSIVSGVLNVLRLDVRSARTRTLHSVAVMEWIVQIDPNAPRATAEIISRELRKSLENEEELSSRIQSRIDAYAQLPTIPVPAPIVEAFSDAATDATVIEVRSHDRPALLFRIGDIVRRSNIDIRSAIVTTLGAEAIDTLYVTEIGGGALTQERADEVTSLLSHSLK